MTHRPPSNTTVTQPLEDKMIKIAKKVLCCSVLVPAVFMCSCTLSSYGEPPETSDPWVLIRSAREWLQKGRPRGAMPSLERALIVAEEYKSDEEGYAHVKAAVHNELGRVYEMVSDLEKAEREFMEAAEIAKRLPEYRPLHFDISYNLSTVYERRGMFFESCVQLRRSASLQVDLLTNPASPPEGLGENTDRVLRELAAPRILARAKRIACDVKLD